MWKEVVQATASDNLLAIRQLAEKKPRACFLEAPTWSQSSAVARYPVALPLDGIGGGGSIFQVEWQ
jgi:hypothetical protein